MHDQWHSYAGSVLANVVERLKLRAKQEPERTAFCFLSDAAPGGATFTFRQLDRRARAIAAALVAAGARGERALLLHPPGLDYIAAVYGCFYAGVVATPLYPPRRGRGLLRVRGVQQDCAARFALTTSTALRHARGSLGDDAAFASLQWLCTDELPDQELVQEPLVTTDELILLQYTSGSTSEPKGVMLSHRQLSHNLEQISARTRICSDDRIVLWLPPYHDLGLINGVLMPVWSGATAYLLPPSAFLRRPGSWLEAISNVRGTMSGAPNFGYERCVQSMSEEQRARLDLSSWRVALNGAERVSGETLTRFAQAFAPSGFDRAAFAPGYGLAEATLGVTLGIGARSASVRTFDSRELGQRNAAPLGGTAPALTPSGIAERVRGGASVPGEAASVLVSSGTALDDVELRIVEPATRATLPNGRVGEIWVRSISVALGYFRKPELSEAVFRARPSDAEQAGPYLRTGDLGFVLDGELFVVGRLKDLLIIAGANYYPDDIEAAVIGCHPDVRGSVAAFSIGDERANTERVVVALEIAARSQTAASEIVDAVRAAVGEALELAVHEVVLLRSGALPKTSSGKVQRGLCRTQYLEGRLDPVVCAERSAGDAAAPVPAELVARLQHMLCELLELEALGADDNWFEAGAHSLIATRLVSRVHAQLGVELELRTVFEAPTARRLAAKIAAAPPRPSPPALTRADRNRPLPLSFSQERMWVVHRLDPQGAAYNVCGACELRGRIDLHALERAFDALLERHEVLRSNYPLAEDGTPHVVIAQQRRLALEQADVAAEADPLAAALALGSRLSNAPFDVARDALVRAAVYRVAVDRHVLVVSMHHLVTDAWSMGLLADDLFGLYQAFSRGGPTPQRAAVLSELSYVDYAAWERAHAPAGFARALAYWKQALHGAVPLELPSDHPRPHAFSSAGAFEPLELPEGLLDALRSVGAARDATLFMVMLAAFELLLHRYSGQSDLIVGVPVANRGQLSAEPFIGTLVNMLAFRSRLQPELRFSDWLARVRETALQAFAHQELPFEQLVKELVVEREPGRSPLVQVMFDFQNAPMRAVNNAALAVRPLMLSRGAAQFDLSLLILDTEFGRTAGIEYRSDLFERSTIVRLMRHYVAILQAIVQDPEQHLSALNLIKPAERDAIVEAGRGPEAAPEATRDLPQLFAEQVAAAPDAPALIDAGGTLSYRELDRRSNALASRLRGLGAQSGRRVAVYLERSSEVVVALLAVLKTEAAYVPIDPRFPPLRLALVLDDCDPGVVITSSALLPSLAPELAQRALVLDRTDLASDFGSEPLQRASRAGAIEAPPRSAGAVPPIAYVMYTSGSTGRPKGVEVPMSALSNFLCSMRRSPGIRASDRLLAVTTVGFDIAGLELFLPLIAGAAVYVAAAEVAADGAQLARCIEDVRPTLMQATPATWKMLLDVGWPGSPELTLLCGGEALARELAAELLPRCKVLWNLYGPTETTIWSTLHRVGASDVAASTPVPVGKPIAATRVYVLDAEHRLVPFGVQGEIAIGGAGVANGYLHNPELSAERFLADPFAPEAGARLYRTGDRGQLDASGTLFCFGRLDDQIKIRGFRVEPGEIESVLKDEFGLRDAAVVAREDRPGERQLIAYCVTGAQPLPEHALLQARLRPRLPHYMLPARCIALDELPCTPNGKVDRNALLRSELERAPARVYAPPRDALETHMVALWQRALEVPQVGIDDNFFELGGHSLLAVRLFAAIERELDVSLPLTAVLETHSLAELTERVRNELPRSPLMPEAGVREAPRRGSRLVLLRAGAARVPVLCVHGAGGNVVNLHALAQRLTGDRAVYGVVAPGVDGIGPRATSIEDMASRYVAEVRRQLGEGPLHLVGYCGGGLVAYEMARMLTQQGREVGLLALIDSYHPQVDTRAARRRMLRGGLRREGMDYVLRRSRAFVQRNLSELEKAARLRLGLVSHGAVPFRLRDHWLTVWFFQLARAYRPQPYQRPVTILRAAERDPLLRDVGPELGWAGTIRGPLELEEIPGNHDTIALEPNVAALAEKLSASIHAAERRIGRR